MNYKFAQLIQTPGKKSKTISETYISQPDIHKEKLAGKLFIIIEINKNNVSSLKIINFLIDSIVQNFYQNEKLLLRERMPNLKIEHIFEASLAKTNKQFTDFLKNEKIKISFDDINITVGVIFKNKLYIANNGKNNVFLIFLNNNKKHEKNNEFSIVNILNTKDKQNEQKKYRLFSNVINGQIPNKSSIFISNEALPEYISQKQLVNIISTLPPISAVEQIKNIINNINTYVSFVAIIIKNSQLEKKPNIPQSNAQASYDSIASLNQTEDITETLLTPSGMINFKKWLRLLSLIKIPINNKNKKRLLLKDKILVKKRSLFNKIKIQLLKFFSNIIQAVIYIYKIKPYKKIIKKILKIYSNKLEKFKVLKLKKILLISKKKILLTLFVFFLFAFSLNLSKTNKNKQINLNNQKYNELFQQIEQKQNQAEANLLYSNDEGAKKLFNEINILLNKFPQTTEQQQQQYQIFKEKFNKQLDKIRRITKIDNAEIITNFNNLNSNSQAQNIILIEKTNKIYCADPKQKSVYILDLFDNISSAITELEQPIEELKSPVANINEDDANIYYLNKNKIISLDTNEEKFTLLDVKLDSQDNISDFNIYNNNFYLINTEKNNIYRYKKNKQALSSSVAWLNEKINLQEAISLSIDGYIYILNKDSSVIKLLSGSKTNFKLEKPDPPLENATKITVSKKLNFMYILEPKNHRLLVYNKDGQFLMQYMGENLKNLKDFAIDEKKEIIYLLNSSQIYKIKAIHFK